MSLTKEILNCLNVDSTDNFIGIFTPNSYNGNNNLWKK